MTEKKEDLNDDLINRTYEVQKKTTDIIIEILKNVLNYPMSIDYKNLLIKKGELNILIDEYRELQKIEEFIIPNCGSLKLESYNDKILIKEE